MDPPPSPPTHRHRHNPWKKAASFTSLPTGSRITSRSSSPAPSTEIGEDEPKRYHSFSPITSTLDKTLPSIEILCSYLNQEGICRVRDDPPVFVASTTRGAETMMELFEAYYIATYSQVGPVGFDTETTVWRRNGGGGASSKSAPARAVSLVQIATKDICLLFQVFRITHGAKDKSAFPEKLKRFLEDPDQLLIGVGAKGDGDQLKESYGVDCQGIVDLVAMAREKKLLVRSLAELDAMYGCPGREVIKTTQLLKWDWDAFQLVEKAVWYAAKDAFAGLAIYDNMRADRIKPGYLPLDQLEPMTREEEIEQIYEMVLKTILKGKFYKFGKVQSIISHYRRWEKIYQPEDRIPLAYEVLKQLLYDGRLSCTSSNGIPLNFAPGPNEQQVSGNPNGPESSTTTSSSEGETIAGVTVDDSVLTNPGTHLMARMTQIDEVEGGCLVYIPGQSWSTLMRTEAGLAYISQYFENRMLNPKTIPATGVSLIERDFPFEERDLAMTDLRTFVEFSHVWVIPRKAKAIINIFGSDLSAATDKFRRLEWNQERQRRIAAATEAAATAAAATGDGDVEDMDDTTDAVGATPIEESSSTEVVLSKKTKQKQAKEEKAKNAILMAQIFTNEEAFKPTLMEWDKLSRDVNGLLRRLRDRGVLHQSLDGQNWSLEPKVEEECQRLLAQDDDKRELKARWVQFTNNHRILSLPARTLVEGPVVPVVSSSSPSSSLVAVQGQLNSIEESGQGGDNEKKRKRLEEDIVNSDDTAI